MHVAVGGLPVGVEREVGAVDGFEDAAHQDPFLVAKTVEDEDIAHLAHGFLVVAALEEVLHVLLADGPVSRRAFVRGAQEIAAVVAGFQMIEGRARAVAFGGEQGRFLGVRQRLTCGIEIARAEEHAGVAEPDHRLLRRAPQRLAILRQREYQTLLGVLLILGLIAWWRRGQRLDPHIGLALGAFLVAYLPVSNLFSLNATVAEHWLYVPSAFLFLAAALSLSRVFWGNAEAQRRGENLCALAPLRFSIFIVLGLWAVFLGARTFLRQADWRDQRTFIEHTIADGGGSPRMHMNLGNVESATGRQDLALEQYGEALRRAPEQSMIWLGYANVLLRTRDFDATREALAHAEKSPLLTAECFRTRAALDHLETGHDSGNLLRAALESAPRNWSIRKQYVEYLLERGDDEEAMREMRDVLVFHGFRNEEWILMGRILESINRPDLALNAYRQAADRDVHDEATRARIRELAASVGSAK